MGNATVYNKAQRLYPTELPPPHATKPPRAEIHARFQVDAYSQFVFDRIGNSCLSPERLARDSQRPPSFRSFREGRVL